MSVLEVGLAEFSRAVDVPLSSIAKKAGVGRATFYRNFPNREALVLEVYRHEVQLLTDAATELLQTRALDQDLREWMERLARFAVTKTGLSDAMRQIVGTTDAQAQPGYAQVVEVIEALLDGSPQEPAKCAARTLGHSASKALHCKNSPENTRTGENGMTSNVAHMNKASGA
ncbi:TetR/AcrR family transcriptional regulator [Nocardia sp. NPDC051787]|uniref:TetR/AcrR family transcriptional regulator n=1 Tax=Nocardia sp. NPDC051787 TaxID=3155415 RepID=UPI00343307EC